MEIMVALPLVVPEQALDFAELEQRVQQWGQQVMRQGLAAAWAAQAADRPAGSCPRCGEQTARPAGRKPRKVETSFGPVWLPRQRVQCTACGRHYQPDDAVLTPTLGRGQLSPRLQELASLCGSSWPYRAAADVLGRLRGAPLSPETVRTAVDQLGQAMRAAQRTQAQAISAPAAGAVPPCRAVPTAVTLEPDGAWIAAHDNAHGLEVKVGVVHTGSTAVGARRRRLCNRQYAATAQGVDAFAPLVSAALARVNGFATPNQTVLGDGAAWIWRLGAALLPDATPVLDRWHLHEARRRALRAALPDKATRAPWTARIEDRLEVGDVPGAVAVLQELAAMAPHPRLTEFADYLTTLAPCIPNYAERRAAGQRIGSGGIEKGGDLVANRRLKGRRGMRWWRARVNGLVALRVAVLNEEWDRHLAAARGGAPLPTY